VLNVLGFGSFHPDHRITSEFLKGLFTRINSGPNSSIERVQSRCSVLPPAYIQDTSNIDTRMALKAAEANPSDLSYQAALEAIKRAGIKPKDIGLIIADTSTPHQTTPSEAQRVGQMLELKGPMFDVVDSSGVALPLHIHTLNSWREEALPDYILCLSSNTPTTYVDYSKAGIEAAVLGDGAGAVVLSPRKSGKLKVKESFYSSASVDNGDFLVLELFKHIVLYENSIREQLAHRTGLMLKELTGKVKDVSKLKVIGTQFDGGILEDECLKYGIPAENNWHDLESRGSSIGADAFCALAERWEQLESGQEVAVVLSGLGRGFGYVLLTVV